MLKSIFAINQKIMQAKFQSTAKKGVRADTEAAQGDINPEKDHFWVEILFFANQNQILNLAYSSLDSNAGWEFDGKKTLWNSVKTLKQF